MKVRSDFVTNSSSSSFIIDSNKSLEEVEEMMEEFVKFYNKVLENNYFNSDCYSVFIANEEFEERLIKYSECQKYRYKKGDIVGKVIIESSDDNSIPYSLFTLMEEAFSANRIHL